jgi:ribosomal protein L16 Arg81 hydroxylase
MIPDTNTQNGGGMSRAAKKRAKKNKKTPEQLQVEKAVDDDQEPLKNKKIKLESKKDLKVDPPSKKSSDKEDRNGKAKVVDEIEEADDDHYMSDGDGEEPTPSFPDTPLTEILLLQDSKDKEKAAVLQHLTAKQRAAALFQAIIDPISLDEFYEEYWEKKPLLVRAKNNKNRYDGLLSLESIKKISKQHPLYYGRDLNVTKYQKDAHGVKRRVTLDKLPEDEKDEATGILVNRAELWSNYANGCTIRMLCPHKQDDSVHALLSTLELELKCMVGANAYLTPPNAAQGFAPHHDDIEAFCLQLQGSKRWKVYEPTIKLPRVSSEDFTTEDLKEMEPVLDITLEQGDLLYMPRGYVHQACTLKHNDEHSLHLTVSAMQQWAWCDLLDMIMPEALAEATMSETNTSLRQGLPRGFLDYMGAMHDSSVDPNVPESLKKVGNDDSDEGRGELRMEKAKIRRQEKFRLEAKKRIMKVALQVSGTGLMTELFRCQYAFCVSSLLLGLRNGRRGLRSIRKAIYLRSTATWSHQEGNCRYKQRRRERSG